VDPHPVVLVVTCAFFAQKESKQMKRTGKKTAHPGVRRTGRNSYHVRAMVKCPSTGKRFEKERRMTDVSVAQAVEAQHQMRVELTNVLEERAAVAEGRVAPVPLRANAGNDMPLAEYAEIWIVHVEKSGRKRPHVVDIDANRLDVLVLPLLGHLNVGEIGKPELATWMNRVVKLRKANGEPYAKDTLASAWRLIATMLRDAELLIGVANTSPDHMRFSVQATTVRPKDTLTREELSALLEVAELESPDIRAMLWLLGTTGMRFGEMSALTWDDIDFEHQRIRVRRSQVEGKVFPTKTSTQRTVPILPVVADLLKAHRAWLDQQRFKRADGLLFPSRVGGYRDSAVTRAALRRCARAAGIEKTVTNQALRRTANNLIRQSAGEIAARAITGHTTQAMTEHYSDVTIDEKLAAGSVAFGGLVQRRKHGN